MGEIFPFPKIFLQFSWLVWLIFGFFYSCTVFGSVSSLFGLKLSKNGGWSKKNGEFLGSGGINVEF